jgi:hypothetical protein
MTADLRFCTPSLFLIVRGLIVCAAYSAFLAVSDAQVYVDGSATGANDGSSWFDAYTDLQVALLNTNSGEIWVAQGTYTPITCDPCNDADRLTAFAMKNNVALFGGFN